MGHATRSPPPEGYLPFIMLSSHHRVLLPYGVVQELHFCFHRLEFDAIDAQYYRFHPLLIDA
jgi:hypothetical protein